MADPKLPRAQSPLADSRSGHPTTEWYDFFRELLTLAQEQSASEETIAQLQAAVTALENAEPDLGTIFGDMSVAVSGLLGQVVQVRLVNDELDPGADQFYGTDEDSTKGYHLFGDGGIARLSGSTYRSLQDFVNVMHSPGLIEGGEFSNATGGTMDVAAGTMMIRVLDDNVSSLVFADFPADTVTIPADSLARFIGVEYNGGSPQIVVKTTNTWDQDTEFPLGTCANTGTFMFPFYNPFKVGDPITNIIQRFDAQSSLIRDSAVGGMILANVATRTATLTEGVAWARLNDYDITAKNSSVQTMVSVRPGPGGTVQLTNSLTQWPNTQYTDPTGTLVTMGNNKWAVLWFFVNVGTNAWGFAYGTAEYNNAATASQETIPSYLSAAFLANNILVGRMLFEKNVDTPIVESAFTRVFNGAALADHNQLTNLQGGQIAEYYHLTAAQHAPIVQIGNLADPNADRGLFWDDSAGSYAYFSTGTGVAFNGTVLELNTTLTALAGTSWAANAFPIGSGAGTVAQIAFAANTFPARGSAGNLVAKTITDGALAALDGTGGTDKFLRSDGTNTSELLSTTGTLTLGAAMYGGNLNYRAQRFNGTVGTPTTVLSGEVIMAFSSAGYDGTAMSGATARISWIAEANYAAGSHATQLAFGTTAAGAATQSSRLVLQADGTLRPAVNNTFSFGNSSFRWTEIFATNGTINTSDARTKTPVRPFTDAEIAAAQSLSDEVGFFQFLDAREVKGEFARDHCGLTVQRAIEVMEQHGLDPFNYGFICYDQWPEMKEVRDEDGGVLQEARDEGDGYSFRPDQLDRFIAKGLRENQKRIEARLNSLEGK